MGLNIYVYLAICMLLALFSSKIVKKVQLPNVTGYLIMGLLAGPYCLGIIPKGTIDTLSFIPTIALGFIALSIGAEFKLSYLKKVGKAPVVIAIMEGLGAILVVDLVLIAYGNDVSFSLVLGAIASATAPAATLMVVKQYKAKGPVTSTLLPVVAIDDAVALMGFGISVAIAKALQNPNASSFASSLIQPIIEIVGALVLGAILGLVYRWLTNYFTGRGNRLSITLAMVFICLGICEVFGFSSLLACMAMSAVYVNTSAVYETVFALTDRMTPPIFMLFFFLSGAELDITILSSVGIIGIIYVVFRVVGKVFGAYLGSKLSHAESVVQKYLGFTLIPQAGVAIGLATTAMTVVPEYGPQIRTIILCGTVIYELIGPLTTKMALKKAGEIQ
ncbi:MAG: cation:proton antiporter [Erysipelotrichaceae bacterium]|nr:cation:proton antiporter [Erysipelotrichaceae bacterium]